MKNFKFFSGSFVVASLLLGGCGGGSSSSSGTVDAIALPDKVEVTKLGTDSSGQSGLFRSGLFSDGGTAYTTDATNEYNDDRSNEQAQIVNEILDLLRDAKYDSFVNKGAYKALVRQVGGGKEAQSGSSSGDTTTENLVEATMEVTRASSTSPMEVYIWFDELASGSGDIDKTIYVHATVSEEPSATYPIGKFEVRATGFAVSDTSRTNQLMDFRLKVDAVGGKPQIQIIEDNNWGSGSESMKFKVIAGDTELKNGKGYFYQNSSYSGIRTSHIVFDDNYFEEQIVGGAKTVKSKTDIIKNVHRYKLYNKETGAIKTLNSGFPIKIGDKNGYIGYYGLWMNDGSNNNVANGTTITKMSDNSTYTFVRAKGKMTKLTKSSITLSELNGVEINVWNGSNGDDIVAWNGTKFQKIATRSNSDGTVTEITPVDYNGFSDQWSGGWCESLHSYLRLGALGGSPTNSSAVSYFKEEVVSAPSTNNLVYFGDLTPNNQSDTNDWGTSKALTFDTTTKMLKSGSTDIDFSAAQFGSCLEPILTTTQANSYNSGNWWDAYNTETEYYRWCSGPDSWNQYTALKDSNNAVVTFDPPMTFSYTHTTANDYNGLSTNNGKKFSINYDGFSLQMPYKHNKDLNEWIPLINLKAGTTLSANGVDYVVKPIEVGIKMKTTTDTNSISVDTTITEPSFTPVEKNTRAKPTGTVVKVVKGELL